MGDLAGYRVRDPNYIFRFAFIIFAGVAALGAVLSWRSQILFASEYQEMPTTQAQLRLRKDNQQKRMSLQEKINKKYQLEDN